MSEITKLKVVFLLDEKLLTDSNLIFRKIGIDLRTAVELFLKQVVEVKGLPFPVNIEKVREERIDYESIAAVIAISLEAQKNGTANMSMEEIDAEIAEVRKQRLLQEQKLLEK